MTVVITPVGTSLFTNGAEVDTDIKDYFADIEDLRESDWEGCDVLDHLRTASTSFIDLQGTAAAAELQSSQAIRGQLDHNITVRLLATDTVASRLAAEILQLNAAKVLGTQCSVEFDPHVDVIKGLQVMYPMEFQHQGLPNLDNRLDSIYRPAADNNHNLAINITAGYGAFVPPLVHFSHRIGGVPLYYHFKDSIMVLDLS